MLDRETMEPVPADGETTGELMFRGNLVMKGYLKNPEATAKVGQRQNALSVLLSLHVFVFVSGRGSCLRLFSLRVARGDGGLLQVSRPVRIAVAGALLTLAVTFANRTSRTGGSTPETSASCTPTAMLSSRYGPFFAHRRRSALPAARVVVSDARDRRSLARSETAGRAGPDQGRDHQRWREHLVDRSGGRAGVAP